MRRVTTRQLNREEEEELGIETPSKKSVADSLAYEDSAVWFRVQSSAIDFCFPQLLHRGLGTHRRIVDLLERIGPRFRLHNWKNLDMPVVVVVNRLPIAEILGRVNTAGRGVQHQMEILGHRAHTLQSAAQKCSQVGAQTRPI